MSYTIHFFPEIEENHRNMKCLATWFIWIKIVLSENVLANIIAFHLDTPDNCMLYKMGYQKV